MSRLIEAAPEKLTPNLLFGKRVEVNLTFKEQVLTNGKKMMYGKLEGGHWLWGVRRWKECSIPSPYYNEFKKLWEELQVAHLDDPILTLDNGKLDYVFWSPMIKDTWEVEPGFLLITWRLQSAPKLLCAAALINSTVEVAYTNYKATAKFVFCGNNNNKTWDANDQQIGMTYHVSKKEKAQNKDWDLPMGYNNEGEWDCPDYR